MSVSVLHNFCLLSVLVGAILTSAADVTIYGPNYVHSIIEGMAVTFQLSHALNVSYVPIFPNQSQQMLTNISQHPPVIVSQNAVPTIPTTSLLLPLYGFPLVFAYNLGAMSENASAMPLKLTQRALRGIFLGEITHWNHPNITDLNPELVDITEPIKCFVNDMVDLFAEGLSKMMDENITVSNLLNHSEYVDQIVAAKVLTTPFSIGATWMADAVEHTSKLARLENHEGIFVQAENGLPFALSEFRALYDTTVLGSQISPHNLRGRLTWPLVGILYVIIPTNYNSCRELDVTQRFLNMVLFQEEASRLAHFMGWEPAIPGLLILDHPLGVANSKYDYSKALYTIPCEGSTALATYDRTLATSQELWPFALKILVAYAEINPFLVLGSSSANMTAVLDEMKRVDTEIDTSTDIDLALTWEMVANSHDVTGIPVYMGSIVPVVNVPIENLNLSLSVIAEIYLGIISVWSDSKIRALNPLPTFLPVVPIHVNAAPIERVDGSTALFAKLLNISWDAVNITVSSEESVLEEVEFENFSIGYDFSYNLAEVSLQVPRLVGRVAPSHPVEHSSDSLAACWISMDHPDCWPMAMKLSVIHHPLSTSSHSCKEQKLSVDFLQWIFLQEVKIDPFLVPNGGLQSMGEFEFCNGRSLLRTIPEPQTLPLGLRSGVRAITALAVAIATGIAIALAVARNNNNLRSASVLFSFLGVLGIFIMFVAPFMAMNLDPQVRHCAAMIWSLTIGFSLTYGSLFAKLYRLYKIFTSRSLVVPRLSNRKLFYVVGAFVVTDIFLLIIYMSVDSIEPTEYSLFIDDPQDLVTGQRHLTWRMCNYHTEEPMFNIIVVFKLLVAVGGAAMAFSIRQVDRRFSATTALGWAFYNMFLTALIAVILSFSFNSTTSRAPIVFIITFCGLWIIIGTLIALILDSNVLLACRDLSRPLRRLLASKNSKDKDSKDKDSKDSKDRSKSTTKKDSKDDDPKRSYSSTVFVINREMFPGRYEDFEPELLDKILEEINFQRTAVRRALASKAPVTTTATPAMPNSGIELAEVGDRGRGSTRFDVRKNRPSNVQVNSHEKISFEAKNSFEGSRPPSQLAMDPPSPNASDAVVNASGQSTPNSDPPSYMISIDAPRDH